MAAIRNIDFGYQLHNERAKGLENLLKNWAKVLNRYANAWEGKDAGYYYNERTNVSFLAGAAWLTKGMVALEEYSATKKGVGPKTKKSSGRVDLYLANNKIDAVFEAKHKWMNARTQDPKLGEVIEEYIDLAVEDAARDRQSKAKFGVSFFVPRFSRKRFKTFKDEPELHIREVVQRYTASTYPHLWAWCFPKQNRFVRDIDTQSFYPGVIMGIKAVSIRANGPALPGGGF